MTSLCCRVYPGRACSCSETGPDAASGPGTVTQLQAANAQLKSIAHSLAHDLRGPILTITGFGKALSGSLDERVPQQTRHYLERMVAAAQHLDEYVAALLSLASVIDAPVKAAEVDLSSLAREILEDLLMRDQTRIASFEVQEGLRARGDRRLLRMALENLLGNAWKFTGRRAAARIEFSDMGGADTVYRVKDNGAGFDMSYADKLFGDFQRLHSQAEFPGMGVGLANVRRIVSRHGGRIWAESVVGQGSTFYFTLAAAIPRQAGAAGAGSDAASLPDDVEEAVTSHGANFLAAPRRVPAQAPRSPLGV